MEARILGPLEVLVEGERVEIPGGKQRELLAILLIHANEIVSADALIDGLWGETPPSSALKTLQALVSRLRGTLGPSGEALETRGQGYRLRVERGELDADVFHERLEAARRALARGEAEPASEQLGQALALWRGPALQEFRYADFAQSELARLEELRLAAREERIDAELELGHHAELVVELEELAAEHPLRERLRGQLMLALYRSGRQAEALQAYQEGRRALAEELGLDPSESLRRLERRILDQDPALAAPEPAATVQARSRAPWRQPRTIVAVGVLVLAVAVGAAAYQGTRGDRTVEEAGVRALDPGSGDVVESIPLGSAPSAVSVGEGRVWVLDADDRTVSEIDPETRQVVRTFSTSSTPTDIAAGAGGLWIGSTTSAGGVIPSSVSRVDPASGVLVETIELPPARIGGPANVFPGSSRQHIAVAPDAVWVINPDLTVSRIDPRSNRIVARVGKVRAENIATGDGDVWISEGTTVTEIDTATNAVARRLTLDAGWLVDLAIGGGAVWATDPERGNVWRVDAGRRLGARKVPLEMWVAGLAYGEGAVWATNEITDAIHRIDPRTSETERIATDASPRDVDAGEGEVWVTSASPPSPDAALPRAVCQDVQSGGVARPDLLLVSSLPLQGESRALAKSMVGGIRFVLEQRGYEAGGFSVGFQACDSSTAQAGAEDFFRCGTNAKAFSRKERVVGVVGSYQSFCSYLQIPITNQAPGGPLVMISPSNTVELLTEDDGLYPSGTRSFFRLAALNRLQALAQVELAKQLGHDRLFVLDSGEYGTRYVPDLRAHAKRNGVTVVGSARFDPGEASVAALVRRVARSRPESVAIVDVLSPGSAALVAGLRSALGPDVAISGPDGFFLPDELTGIPGGAAEGMYVTNYGIPNDQLPPKGREFLRSFAAANGGDPGPDLAAAYGAQAAEILLDAIARSDGTRRSVLDEVRDTAVRNGILGNVAWDAQGDLLEGPITVLRVRGGELVVDRVVVARPPRDDR
jgi:DNA-binding SARP family transcriptional activator/ABC-type branched-subunit amino acid transport system substrate-binding protein/DNA-binding beta-propeller fold protein YncE